MEVPHDPLCDHIASRINTPYRGAHIAQTVTFHNARVTSVVRIPNSPSGNPAYIIAWEANCGLCNKWVRASARTKPNASFAYAISTPAVHLMGIGQTNARITVRRTDHRTYVTDLTPIK